jgi:hypothetical protein
VSDQKTTTRMQIYKISDVQNKIVNKHPIISLSNSFFKFNSRHRSANLFCSFKFNLSFQEFLVSNFECY